MPTKFKSLPRKEHTQEEVMNKIESLPVELQTIANNFLTQGKTPLEALGEAVAQEKIQELNPEVRDLANNFLTQGKTPSQAFYFAVYNKKIQSLSKASREIFDNFISEDIPVWSALNATTNQLKKRK